MYSSLNEKIYTLSKFTSSPLKFSLEWWPDLNKKERKKEKYSLFIAFNEKEIKPAFPKPT